MFSSGESSGKRTLSQKTTSFIKKYYSFYKKDDAYIFFEPYSF